MYLLDTLGVKNFNEIGLSRTVKEIASILCFRTFVKNSKIQNGCHFWKFLKSGRMYLLDTLGVKNFDKIGLSRTIKEIASILRFRNFGKNSKIQNGHHFWKLCQKSE